MSACLLPAAADADPLARCHVVHTHSMPAPLVVSACCRHALHVLLLLAEQAGPLMQQHVPLQAYYCSIENATAARLQDALRLPHLRSWALPLAADTALRILEAAATALVKTSAAPRVGQLASQPAASCRG